MRKNPAPPTNKNHKSLKHRTSQQGQTLLEITIAVAILGWIIVMAIASYVNLASAQLRTRLRTQATQYAREGQEIPYNLSLQNWEEFSKLNGDYHPVLSGTTLILQPGNETIAEKFTRSIHIEPARRDPEGNISDKNGVDKDTMKVISTVVIETTKNKQEISLTNYLINLNQTETE